MAAEDCLAAECRDMTVEVAAADHHNKPDVALAIAPFVAQKDRVALFGGGTARLSGDACQPERIVQWMWDTYVQVGGVARRLTRPGTTWYLVTADYAFGTQFEADAEMLVGAACGRVVGTDAWNWDAPFSHTCRRVQETGDAGLIWDGHRVGPDRAYYQIEKMHSLEALPPTGFLISAFPVKLHRGSAGWTRAVAILDA